NQEIVVPTEYQITFGDIPPLLERVHARVSQLLTLSPRPTAFFCGGYHLALEAMKAIQEAGLRIPEDISLVGFDDPISARYLSPALTTVHQPLEEMGQLAACKLVQWLRTQEEPPHRNVLPATLQVRDSTAPVSGDDP